MKYEEMLNAIRNNLPLTTRRCLECGAESTLWFGHGTPCRYNGGSHQKFEEIPTTLQDEINKVKAHYSCCMYYDRENFDKHVPQDIKDIIWKE